MKSKITLFVLTLFATTNTFAHTASNELSHQQKNVKKVAQRVGAKTYLGKSKQNLEKPLQAIAWQESDFGKDIIGDCKHVRYYFKYNNKKINVTLNKIYFKEGMPYTFYKEKEQKVYIYGGFKQLRNGSLGPFQVKVSTAKYLIQDMKLTKYEYLLKNETMLIKKLLSDPEMGAILASEYLKVNYLEAQKNRCKDPLWRTISRYNGGNNNTVYVKLITNKIAKL